MKFPEPWDGPLPHLAELPLRALGTEHERLGLIVRLVDPLVDASALRVGGSHEPQFAHTSRVCPSTGSCQPTKQLVIAVSDRRSRSGLPVPLWFVFGPISSPRSSFEAMTPSRLPGGGLGGAIERTMP